MSYRNNSHLCHKWVIPHHTASYWVMNLEYRIIPNDMSASGLQLAPLLTHATSDQWDSCGASDKEWTFLKETFYWAPSMWSLEKWRDSWMHAVRAMLASRAWPWPQKVVIGCTILCKVCALGRYGQPEYRVCQVTPSPSPHRGIKGPRAERLLNRTYDASRWFYMTRYRDCDVGWCHYDVTWYCLYNAQAWSRCDSGF